MSEGLYTENREILIHHLAGFLNHVQYQKDQGEFICGFKSAERYVDNEIAMEKGMAQYYDYVRECERSDRRLLKAIRSVKGKTFVKRLMEVIDNDGAEGTKMSIVRTPIGEFVAERYGRYIKGYWVDQHAVGTEGDSWNGTICVEIRKDRYLKFHFSI